MKTVLFIFLNSIFFYFPRIGIENRAFQKETEHFNHFQDSEPKLEHKLNYSTVFQLLLNGDYE